MKTLWPGTGWAQSGCSLCTCCTSRERNTLMPSCCATAWSSASSMRSLVIAGTVFTIFCSLWAGFPAQYSPMPDRCSDHLWPAVQQSTIQESHRCHANSCLYAIRHGASRRDTSAPGKAARQARLLIRLAKQVGRGRQGC